MDFTRILTQEDAEIARTLFNDSVCKGEMLYKTFASAKEFDGFFLNRGDTKIITVNLISEDKKAFISGCYKDGDAKGYITMVVVDPLMRRKGYATQALEALETELKKVSQKRATSFEITFFNPMNFSWIIPGTTDHDHPNAPGIDVASDAYIFFKNRKYRDTAYQNSYHVDLSTYSFPLDIVRRIEKLSESGIEITFYDKNKHSDLHELFDDFGNEMWRTDIMTNVQKPDGGDPVLIVNINGRAMGFTGPLSVQPSGRGFFCGIGVHSDCRGNGAGKVLFAYLCKSLKDMDAKFMTLFTGETNLARNIYEAAGFKIVKTWADMRK